MLYACTYKVYSPNYLLVSLQVIEQFGIPHLFDLPIRPTVSPTLNLVNEKCWTFTLLHSLFPSFIHSHGSGYTFVLFFHATPPFTHISVNTQLHFFSEKWKKNSIPNLDQLVNFFFLVFISIIQVLTRLHVLPPALTVWACCLTLDNKIP